MEVWDDFLERRERRAISLKDFDLGRSIGKVGPST